MADRFLSIEVGNSLTKICDIEKGKTVKVLDCFTMPTPEGILRDGAVEPTAEYIDDLRTQLFEHRIKTKRVLFTLSSTKIASRDATFPYMKESRIVDAVRANLTDYFPIEPRQYKFCHTVLSLGEEAGTESQTEAEDGQKGKKQDKKSSGKPATMKLQLLAAPKLLLDSYHKVAEALNMQVVAVDYNGNSIYQAARDDCSKGVQVVIKADERSSMIMILEDGVQSLNRTIPYGVDDIMMALQECTTLGDTSDYEKALEVSFGRSVLLPMLDGHAGEDETAEDKKLVTDSMRPFIGGVIRVIDFYNSNHTDRPVEEIVLTGVGADVVGLANLLSHETRLNTRTLTVLGGVDASKVIKEQLYGQYVTCIGAAISPLEFYNHEDDDKNRKKKSALADVDSAVIAYTILGLGIVASLALTALTLMPYFRQKKLKAGYEETITRLQPSYDVYEQFLAEKNYNEGMHVINNATRNRNAELMDFVTRMEKGMPSTFTIKNISADSEIVTIDATVASKEEVAYALNQFMEDELFVAVELDGVAEVETNLGEIEYSFTVTLTYAPIVDETVEEVQE